MKELTIINLTDTLVRIICKGGKVCDSRTMREYSEVETLRDEIKYYYGI